MIPVQRIGHATYASPDPERQIAYYTDVVGFTVSARDKDRTVLSTRLGHEVLAIEPGSIAQCTRLSFQVASDFDPADAIAHFGKQGIACERRSNITPGIADAVVFTDPKGTEIALFAEIDGTVPPRNVHGVAPMKLGHQAFIVPDAKHMTDFYCDNLGFRVSDWMEDFFSFLRCGADHHTVNFRTGTKTFMHHIAFELQDWAHMHTACETLGMHKVPILWGPLRHGIGHNIAIYHRDPDDHIIEFYTEMDQMKNEALGYFDPRPWHEDRPQRPKVWKREAGAMVWGTPPAPDYLRSRPAMPTR